MAGKKKTISADKPFTPVEDVLDIFREGGMVIVSDHERRENEGDLIVAAEKVTPEAINFMSKHGRGLICVALEQERIDELDLKPMPIRSQDGRHCTAFVESVDATKGTTTGISALDRAHTVQVLVNDSTTGSDLVRPGHVFPLAASHGGVLSRPGHTEAAVDLARLAGLKPGGVICEILREDGQMARLNDLIEVAQRHHLPIISVADLIQYRHQREKLVQMERSISLPTAFGTFQLYLFKYQPDGQHHVALILGNPVEQTAPLVRVHSECLTGDVFRSLRCDCGDQLDKAMKMIAEEGHGIVIYLRQEGRGIGFAMKIHAYALQEKGLDTVEANYSLGFDADHRNYHVSAQILRYFGINQLRLLTNNPEKLEAMNSSGIEVKERVPMISPVTGHNEKYLETKKRKLGHLL